MVEPRRNDIVAEYSEKDQKAQERERAREELMRKYASNYACRDGRARRRRGREGLAQQARLAQARSYLQRLQLVCWRQRPQDSAVFGGHGPRTALGNQERLRSQHQDDSLVD